MDPLEIVLSVAALCLLGSTVGASLSLRRTRRRLLETERRLRELETGSRERSPRLSRRAADLAVRAVVTTARGVREHGVSGFLATSIEEFTGWSVAERLRINKLAGPDGTVTVLFSDIEGSTALNERLGDEEWMALLGEHDGVVRTAVRRYHGHVVKHQGDGFMVVFGSAEAAGRAALEIQACLADADSPALSRTPILVRVGIHTGPTVERDGDFFGRNVAYAARIAAHAAGGEVLVSDDVRTELGELWECAGPYGVDLKGFPGDHQAWTLLHGE